MFQKEAGGEILGGLTGLVARAMGGRAAGSAVRNEIVEQITRHINEPLERLLHRVGVGKLLERGAQGAAHLMGHGEVHPLWAKVTAEGAIKQVARHPDAALFSGITTLTAPIPGITEVYLGAKGLAAKGLDHLTAAPKPLAPSFHEARGPLPAEPTYLKTLPAQIKAAYLAGQQAALQKYAARAGLRQIGRLLGAGETAAAQRLAKTPGVLKPSAAGSQIRHLGSGMEGTSTLVAHPTHGIAVRKVYDPKGISGPAMVANKAQAGQALRGHPDVAQFHGEVPTKIGPAHFYEHVPGAPGIAQGTPAPASSAEAAARVRAAGPGIGMRLHDVHEGNVVGGKVVDYLPVRPGAPTGLRTDVLDQGEAASAALAQGRSHPFTDYLKDPRRPGNLMARAFRGAAPLVPGSSPVYLPKSLV